MSESEFLSIAEAAQILRSTKALHPSAGSNESIEVLPNQQSRFQNPQRRPSELHRILRSRSRCQATPSTTQTGDHQSNLTKRQIVIGQFERIRKPIPSGTSQHRRIKNAFNQIEKSS